MPELKSTKLYMTGRSQAKLEEVAQEIKKRGGDSTITVCDHGDDEQTKAVFDKIEMAEGRMDLLVNNAYGGVKALFQDIGKPFWDIGPSKWDTEMRVGLRSAYVCTALATKIMMKANSGIIVNISSSGGMRYFVTPLYGVRTCGMDRMVQDCHEELRKYGKNSVHMVGLWPGPVGTEKITEMDKKPSYSHNSEEIFLPRGRETMEFPGLCVRHLMEDDKIGRKSGRIFNTVDLAKEFGFVDVDGKMPVDLLSVRNVLLWYGYKIGAWIPKWIKAPKILFTIWQHKF